MLVTYKDETMTFKKSSELEELIGKVIGLIFIIFLKCNFLNLAQLPCLAFAYLGLDKHIHFRTFLIPAIHFFLYLDDK